MKDRFTSKTGMRGEDEIRIALDVLCENLYPAQQGWGDEMATAIDTLKHHKEAICKAVTRAAQPDNEDAQGILRALKVLPDPRFIGGHPLHQNRYIVTEDCVLEVDDDAEDLCDHRVTVEGPGEIIAELTDCDHQAEYARLFAAAPAMRDLLPEVVRVLEAAVLIAPNDMLNTAWGHEARAALAKAKNIT